MGILAGTGLNNLTCSLLGLVSGDGAKDIVFVTADAVSCALDISLRLSSLVFGFALSVLLLARLLPVCGAGQVADL